MVTIAMCLGLRVSEILALKWADFDFEEGTLDACGAPIGVQQKLMRHAQVSTTMQYGNAYMTENGRRTVRSCKWYYPQKPLQKPRLQAFPLSVGLRGDLKGNL